nr:phosphoadenylyl-sulfate reductase [Miltoncostaea marina]
MPPSSLSLSAEEVEQLAEEFEGRSAQDLLAWAVERFAGRIVLTCSWQHQSSILIDMLHQLGADIRIVELDTGLLFRETYETRDRLIERYGIEVERIDPRLTVAEQEREEGPELWRRDPDRCCHLRKVEPLERALVGMDAWITGIRRAQSVTRANARMLELDPRGVVKVQPLAAWSDEDVKGYLFAHDVPYNPLHDRGYPSIGCTHCTRPVRPGEDSRAGRWADAEKTECGLHLPAQQAAAGRR